MTGLLDTNVALYLPGGRLANPLPAGGYGISVITEMELLALAVTHSRRRERGSRVPRSSHHLRANPSHPCESSLTAQRTSPEATGCGRLRDRVGVRSGTLVERQEPRESARADLPVGRSRCPINTPMKITHQTTADKLSDYLHRNGDAGRAEPSLSFTDGSTGPSAR